MENTYKSNIIGRSMVMLILCHLIRCKIEANVSLYPFSTAALVWDVAATHMVVVNQANATLEYYDFSSSQLSHFSWNITGINQIVTNSADTPSNYFILLFASSTIYCTTTLVPIYLNYPYNLTNVMTRGFGNNKTQIYGTDISGNYTKFIWQRLVNNYTANYTTINYLAKCQVYNNYSVFYALSNASSTSDLVIYQTSSAGQPNYFNHYLYPNCPTMTLDTYSSYIVVNCGNFAEVRSANSPYLPIINITLANSSDQVVIINNNSIIAKSHSYLYQYSILNGQLMDSQRYNISYPNKMRRVGPNSVYLFTNQSMGAWYNFSDIFLCQSNCTCGSQYIVVNSTCIAVNPPPTNTTINSTVNSTNITNAKTNITNNNTNITNTSNITNSTNSTVMNSTNATINSINTTMNSTTNVSSTANTTSTTNNTSLTNITSTQSSSSSQIYSQSLRTASVVVGNSISILSIRFIMKSNIPVTLFLQQFYLYKYYTGVEYPQFMAIFMQEIEVINLLKIKPDFMNFMETNYSIERSFFYSNLYTNDYNSYSPLYFTQSIKQFFSSTIPLNLSIFIAFKFFAILFSKLRFVTSFGFVKMLHESFDSQSRPWALFLTIMQADFLANSFYCLNQIAMTYSYSLQNKTNLFGALLLFYIIFIYGLIGYPLMKRWCRKFSEQLLVFSKRKRQSFWLQNSTILSLKLIKSFGHSIIFSNPEYRFGFLVAADCIILLYIFKIRSLFYNNLHLFTYFAYQAGVLFVNVLLLLRQNLFLENSEQLGYIIQYTMITLFSFTILKFLLSLYRAAYQLFQLLFSKNKVAPHSASSQSNQKNQLKQKKEVQQKKNKQKVVKKTKKILCKKSKELIEVSKKQSIIEQIQQMNKNEANTIFRYNNKKFKQKDQKSKNNNNMKQKKIHMVARFKTQRKKEQPQSNFSPFGNDFSLH